jgi:hypothetical protein
MKCAFCKETATARVKMRDSLGILHVQVTCPLHLNFLVPKTTTGRVDRDFEAEVIGGTAN